MTEMNTLRCYRALRPEVFYFLCFFFYIPQDILCLLSIAMPFSLLSRLFSLAHLFLFLLLPPLFPLAFIKVHQMSVSLSLSGPFLLFWSLSGLHVRPSSPLSLIPYRSFLPSLFPLFKEVSIKDNKRVSCCEKFQHKSSQG